MMLAVSKFRTGHPAPTPGPALRVGGELPLIENDHKRDTLRFGSVAERVHEMTRSFCGVTG